MTFIDNRHLRVAEGERVVQKAQPSAADTQTVPSASRGFVRDARQKTHKQKQLVDLKTNFNKTFLASQNDIGLNPANSKALPATVTTPADNPQSNEKIALGKLLFWDPILSGGKDVSCGTCHHASLGYTDNLDLSIGSNGVGFGASRHFTFPNDIVFTKRNASTIVNSVFNGIDLIIA